VPWSISITSIDGAVVDIAANPRILVVDDNDDNRYTLTLYLELEGYTNLVIAENGEEAIAQLKDNAFDLVLLDVMMPKVDGYQVLTWMKGESHLSDLPVVMISALNEMNSVVRCIELGAVDYLQKPFNQHLLRARLGASLDKKRLRDLIRAHLARLETEIDAARSLQLSMLPRDFPQPSPDYPVELYATMQPAREVGGDLYDFFRTDDGKFCFLVGDVSGKGMPAALFMARTKSLIRVVTELMRSVNGGTQEPAEIIGRVNRELCQNNDSMMFVTLFFGILDPKTGALAYCNAGHNPPYRLAKNWPGAVDDSKGLILGVRPNAVYETGLLNLAIGETLYVFTDGVTEAANEIHELFAEQRLERALAELQGEPCRGIVAGIKRSISEHVGAAEPSDDIAMLALRRLDPATL
jgi:sigma-B regulation protein RsbU (phosphoserine phosphatase)